MVAKLSKSVPLTLVGAIFPFFVSSQKVSPLLLGKLTEPHSVVGTTLKSDSLFAFEYYNQWLLSCFFHVHLLRKPSLNWKKKKFARDMEIFSNIIGNSQSAHDTAVLSVLYAHRSPSRNLDG